MRNGFKRVVVMGVAASALAFAGGCRDQSREAQVPQYTPAQEAPGTGGAGLAEPGQQPLDINRQRDQEGFKTVPPQQTLPSGIQRDQGGSGIQQPVDVNPQSDQEGFKTVPEQQKLPSNIGEDDKDSLKDRMPRE